MRSGDIKTIADVRVGDFVLAASASGKTSFSEVDISTENEGGVVVIHRILNHIACLKITSLVFIV